MNGPASSPTTRAPGRDTSQQTAPPLPEAPASATETATVVQWVDACIDPRWDSDECGRGCVDTQDANGNPVDSGPVRDGEGGRLCRAGGSRPGTCSCSGNGSGGEAQTIIARRKDVGPSGTSSYLVTTTDSSAMGSSSTTVAVIPAKSSSASSKISSAWIPDHAMAGTLTTTSTARRASTTEASFTTITTILTIPISPPHHPPTSPSSRTATTSPDHQEPTTNTTNLATKLGLGLGIPFLVLLVVITTACIHRRQRNLQQQQQRGTPKHEPPSSEFPDDALEAPPVRAVGHLVSPRGDTAKMPRYGPLRDGFWPEWAPGGDIGNHRGGAGVGGGGGGGGGGEGPYDDNQVGYVSPLGFQGYYRGHQVPLGRHWREQDLDPDGSPHQYQYQEQYQDPEATTETSSPYDDQGHLCQVPTVRVQQAEQEPHEHQRHSTRVHSGQSGGLDEVSPLSSSGSGPPYPRVSAMSGLG